MKVNLQAVKALFGLEINSRFAEFNLKSWKGIVKLIILILALGGLVIAYTYIVKSLLTNFQRYNRQNLFLTLFYCLLGIAFSVSGITAVEKSLFMGGNNELLLKYPVKYSDVYLAKAALQLITMFVYNLIAQLPVLIVYGVLTQATAKFYLQIPLALIFSTFFIFCLSTLLSFPFMRIKAYTRDRYVLTLIISICVVAFLFAIYMIAVQGVLNFMETEVASFFSDKMMVFVSNICNYIIPFKLIVNMLILQKFWLNLLLVILILAAVAVAAYYVIKKYYLNSIYITIEMAGCSFEKAGKPSEEANFATLFRKDFFEILRSINYSFQYLAMSLAAPIMTYFCAKMAVSIGSNILGNSIVPALSMLVVLIFVTIMVSFSATSISRMGDAFYMTKVSPVPYKIQVLVKFSLYMMVATFVILMSTLVLVFAKYVTFGEGVSMFVICMLYAVAETCMSIKMDIIHPNFPIGEGDELTGGTLNTFISMLVGFIVSVFVGVVGIVISALAKPDGILTGTMLTLFPTSQSIAFLLIGTLAFLFCAGMVVWLFVGLEKAYAKITPLR